MFPASPGAGALPPPLDRHAGRLQTGPLHPLGGRRACGHVNRVPQAPPLTMSGHPMTSAGPLGLTLGLNEILRGPGLGAPQWPPRGCPPPQAWSSAPWAKSPPPRPPGTLGCAEAFRYMYFVLCGENVCGPGPGGGQGEGSNGCVDIPRLVVPPPTPTSPAHRLSPFRRHSLLHQC